MGRVRQHRKRFITIRGRRGIWLVCGGSSLPQEIWWSWDDEGHAIGPDGSPLGLWAHKSVIVRPISGDGHLGAQEFIFIEQIQAYVSFAPALHTSERRAS